MADQPIAHASPDTDQPHPHWESLRAQCPVSRNSEPSAQGRPVYTVATWAEAKAVLRDPETFASFINAEGTAGFMGPVLLAMDGAQHKSRRQLIAHAFRTSQLARWEQTLIAPIITDLCAAVAPRGKAELVEEVISRFPVQVICGICGVPAEDSPRFLQWAKEIHRGMYDPAVGKAAADAIKAYLEPLVEERRVRPTNDLISDIVHAEVDGERLDDAEIYGFLRLLLPAGSESTFRATGSALLALLKDPDLLARVRADYDVLGSVIEETLRWDVSNSMVSRVATRDTMLGGCPIPAGASIRVVTNSANRDESQFSEPARFDVDRPGKRHLGFGMGPHQCLGQPLARIEMRIGLEVILRSLPNIRLDPAFPEPVIQGASFRGPDALNVIFDRSA